MLLQVILQNYKPNFTGHLLNRFILIWRFPEIGLPAVIHFSMGFFSTINRKEQHSISRDTPMDTPIFLIHFLIHTPSELPPTGPWVIWKSFEGDLFITIFITIEHHWSPFLSPCYHHESYNVITMLSPWATVNHHSRRIQRLSEARNSAYGWIQRDSYIEAGPPQKKERSKLVHDYNDYGAHCADRDSLWLMILKLSMINL